MINSVSALFKGKKDCDKQSLIKHIENTGSLYLSPGAMSDSPDRFDGFHSYGLCCRKKKDKGRFDKNMNSYAQDRRAYEEWADGDWNKANKIMNAIHNAPKMICPKCNNATKKTMTADHIGPISLGFCHSIFFAPMCKSCNSSKNNKLSESDIKTLLELESKGETVISWHSKYVWDKLKNTIQNDNDAIMLSKIMNACHKNVLYLFFLIYSETGKDFLMQYLHPNYAMYNHRIKKLNLTDTSKSDINSEKTNSLNKQKNKRRYIRIAFDSLEKVGKKTNRRIKILINADTPEVKKIITNINQQELEAAVKNVNELIESMANSIITLYKK